MKLDNYNPSSLTSEQLRDDFRLLCAKYVVSGYGEFENLDHLLSIGRLLIREILSRRSTTFHPKAMAPKSLELLVLLLDSVIFSGITLASPHGRGIFDGEKTSILKSQVFPSLLDFQVLVSNKLAYGYVRFREPQRVSIDKISDGFDRHRVDSSEVSRWWPRRKYLYEYRVRDFVPFLRPRPVQQNTTQSFIPRVRFSKRHCGDDEIVLIPNFISIVGSSAYGLDDSKSDIDVLCRLEKSEHTASLCESVGLRMFQRFDPDKTGRKIHHLFNPHGPHDDYLPLYDLVLRPVDQTRIIKQCSIRLDLGCGSSTPDGYIGIDLKAESDMVWNLENGIPFSTGCVEEVRAYHILEHLQSPLDIMSEIFRVLKPNGVFRFEIPSTKGEGAFAHPQHKSFWNKSGIEMYCSREGADVIGFSGLFKIESIEEETRGESVYVRGVLRADKPVPVSKSSGLVPFGSYTPPKPTMAGRTEAFSTDELWPWVQNKWPVAVEPKLNGFRVVIEKKGSRIRIKTEGGKDITSTLPQLVPPLSNFEEFILDCSLWIERDGIPLSRRRLMTLLSDRPELSDGDQVKVVCFDLPFYKSDLSSEPFRDRRTVLEAFFSKIHDDHFDLVDQFVVKDRKHFDRLFRELADKPGSEGMMIKSLTSTWPGATGRADGWAKLKIELELKVEVLDIQSTKSGSFNYSIGLSDKKSLGKTFSTSISAKKGDILTVTVQELNVIDDSLKILGATVVDRDPDRTEPYSPAQALDMAKRRGSVLQKKLELETETNSEVDEGTRAERASANWKEHWHEMFPVSGTGTFVYQHHWRGLSEKEASFDEKRLFSTNHSVHGDIRGTYSADFAWGFTLFTGKGKNPQTSVLQGVWKLNVPNEWLKITSKGPYVSEPNAPGSTSNSFSKFFEQDRGIYHIGVWREHFFEVFFEGKELKGRYLIQYAPVNGKDERIWLIQRPDNQTPYARTHRKESVIDEVRKKGQRWLIWSSPGEKPEKIDVQKLNVSIQKSNDRRIVYGVVMEPEEIDGTGDIQSCEEIERACFTWMMKSHPFDVQHARDPGGFCLLENYIARQDEQWGSSRVKKGSWIVGVFVGDDGTWKKIKSGAITGYSIDGYANGHIEFY